MKRSYQQVCEDLLVLLSRTKAAAAQLADEQGMTHMQLFALYSINRSRELAMGQVAGVLHCDASNVTGIVDRMATQDLITREECPTDRRTKTLRLTDKGQRIVDELSKELPVRLGCSNLSADERETLHALLQKLGA